MLSQRLLASLKEIATDVDKVPETKASRAFRLFFEARGKTEALLAVLAAVRCPAPGISVHRFAYHRWASTERRG